MPVACDVSNRKNGRLFLTGLLARRKWQSILWWLSCKDVHIFVVCPLIFVVGVQLDSKTKEIEWDPEKSFPKEDKEVDGMPIPRHSLMIKQVSAHYVCIF